MMPEPVRDYINKNYERSLDDLFEFLSIPDVSTDVSHVSDMQKAADWLLGYLRRMGMDGKIYSTPGNPIIFAELGNDKNMPTLMVYSHYDIAPPGRMEEWKTLPFSPVTINGSIYGRGAIDDKGQLFSVLQGIDRSWRSKGNCL